MLRPYIGIECRRFLAQPTSHCSSVFRPASTQPPTSTYPQPPTYLTLRGCTLSESSALLPLDPHLSLCSDNACSDNKQQLAPQHKPEVPS